MGPTTDSTTPTATASILAMPLAQHAQTLANAAVLAISGVLATKGVSKDSAPYLAAAIVAFVAPLLIAIYQRAKLWITPAGASTIGPVAPSSTSSATLALLLIVTLAIGSNGCSPTPAHPTRRLAAADEAYITAVDSLKAAIDGKLITDPAALSIIRATKDEANAVLAKAHATTQPADLEFWTRAAEAEVPKLVKLYADLEAAKKAKAAH